jgi:hypothetical protein
MGSKVMVKPGVPFSQISVGVEDLLRDGTMKDITKKLLHKAYVKQKKYL